MKTRSVKLLALLIAIILIVSSLPIFATAADDLQYNYSKEYNSGKRGEVCTTLNGTSASSYYTGSYTYENLITLSSSGLETSLHNLMTDTHKYISSYANCRDMAIRTDCENGRGNASGQDNQKVTLIYTSYEATRSQYNGWNREHVWPKSLGGNSETGGGADLHHIRPSDAGVNSSRGNKPYGYAGSGATEKYGTNPAIGWLGGTYNSTYFEPEDYAKGDVARIILYVYVRWGSDWGADSVTEVFQSVDVLLEWCELDPVDTWEMGRNEVVQKIQGNRNVFIDYPELAWQLYGKAVPEDMATPSNAAANGNVPQPPAGGGNENPDTPSNPGTSTTPAEIPESFVLKNQGMYVTATESTYTSSTGSTKKQFKLSSNKSDAVTLKLVKNSDDTVYIKNGDKYLYADGTDVKYVTTAGDNTEFVLEWAGDGYYIKCANATYQSKPQYLEVYNSSLTCYGLQSGKESMYKFTFESVNGSSTPSNPGSEETTTKPSTPPAEEEPNKPSTSAGLLAEFDFGTNSSASHVDGNSLGTSKTYSSGGYSLQLNNMSSVYGSAYDAKGNSCLKLGTSKVVGGFSFTVPADVDKVVIYAAKYKANASKITINGTSTSLTKNSNDGQYDAIEIDTTSNKTVTLTTVSGGLRCMINTIEFWSNKTEVETETQPPQIEIETTESITPPPSIEPEQTETETKAPAVEPEQTEATDTTPEVETTIPEIETTIPEVETTVPEVETTTPEVETNAPDTETNTESGNNGSTEIETNTPGGSSTPDIETNIPGAETTAPGAESNPPVAETTPTPAPEQPDEPAKKKGCKSSVTCSMAVVCVSLVGLYTVIRRKKED